MMPVLAIGSRVVERLLPWLTRLAKTSPSTWTKLLSELKAKGVAAGDSAASIVAYARQNPVNATMVLTTVASLGVMVSDLFKDEDKNTVEGRKTVEVLDRIAQGESAEVTLLIGNATAASETLRPGVAAQATQIALLRNLLGWARGQFGSDMAILEAHQKLQAFMELPYADVEAGLRLLKR